jgi:general nucleoside transport system permease protein
MPLLESRPTPSATMRWGAPLAATLLMLVTGTLLFLALGKPPVAAFRAFFVQPLLSVNGLSELILKASPLILVAQGLAICYRANVWNIGAEGQLVVGAICAGALAVGFDAGAGRWLLPAMIVAGAAGGMLWAAIPALLKTRFQADETLTTLMLVYVANLLLIFMVNGPLKDPQGMNFPQTIMFGDAATFTPLVEGLRVNSSVAITILVTIAAWLFSGRSFVGYTMQVTGLAPAAARYAGFPESRAVWLGMLISGAAAGLAGVGEVAGPVGQLNPSISPGYGFAAIIVAWLGRLHPIGIVLAGLLTALLYIGGEAAQMTLQLPNAITRLFQGLLLFYLLGADVFVHYRLRRQAPRPVAPVAAVERPEAAS